MTMDTRDDYIVPTPTDADVLANAKRAWHRAYDNYPQSHVFPFARGRTVAAISAEIDATDSLDAFDAAIGVAGWTHQTCTVCGASVRKYLRVGEPPDYESATVYLCLACAIRVGEVARVIDAQAQS